MVINLFDSLLPKERTKKLLIISMILFPLLMIIVNFAFEFSSYPVSFTESQLSFNGSEIKSHYAQMNSEEIHLYKIAQIIDYAFLLVYGSLIFSLGIYIGRTFQSSFRLQRWNYYIAITGIIAASCDAIENTFILLMASNPYHFNNSFAIIHSVFASIKFGLLGISIIWILLMIIIKVIEKKKIQK